MWFVPNNDPGIQGKKIGTMAQALNNLHMVDVSDPTNPTLIAEFPYPEVPEDFPYKNFQQIGLGVNAPFGPHNIHEPMPGKPWLETRGDRLYCCYFHAGLRVYRHIRSVRSQGDRILHSSQSLPSSAPSRPQHRLHGRPGGRRARLHLRQLLE